MSATGRPSFRSLSRTECEAILTRHEVGRLAYTHEGGVDIIPIHYVYSGGWIYGRTSEGKKLAVSGHAWRPVAFEVDEVEDLFRWRSVVARGGYYTIPSEGGEAEMDEWRRGVGLLRTLIPETFTEADPVEFRTVLFRIAVEELTGREARPAGDGAEGTAGG